MAKGKFSLESLFGGIEPLPGQISVDVEKLEPKRPNSNGTVHIELNSSRGRGRKSFGIKRTCHSFQIEDELWAKFEDYVEANGGNQTRIINDLIRQVVEQKN